jgi:hypothetical protein
LKTKKLKTPRLRLLVTTTSLAALASVGCAAHVLDVGSLDGGAPAPSSSTGVDGCSVAPSTECGVDSSGNSICGGVFGGGGFVSVELDPPTAASAASTIFTPYFNHGVESSPGQTFGDCAYDADGADRTQSGVIGAPAPNPGAVTVTGPTLAVTATPACDGTYAPVPSTQTFAAGDLLTFGWSPPKTDPDTFPTGLPQVPAPHLITLGAGQAFAPASPTVPRANDVAVTWTVSGTPMALEQVIVLVTQGKATVTCAFAASTGSGVIPADALLNLDAGAASYGVFSEHADALESTQTSWDVQFAVEAMATTPTGIAKGTMALE